MKIINKQITSNNCFVCGVHNDCGLKMNFYETDEGELVSFFTARDEHQSYPNRAHGGIIAAVLDETIGRSILILEKGTWGVTTELNVKFRKPVPLNVELKVVARIIKNSRLLFTGTGEIVDDDGIIYATAVGKYLKTPLEKITGLEDVEGEWITSELTSEEIRTLKDKNKSY